MKTWKTSKGTELQIMSIKGKDYLQVAQRLVWFREEKPLWSIETSIQSVTEDQQSQATRPVILGCIAKALIKDESGRILSVAHKYEDPKGFDDFREKAETGAIGRALALLGYGTQFCADELDEGERLADSPIAKPNPHAPSNMQPGPEDGFALPNPEYRVDFGKYDKKGIHEIPSDELDNYIEYLENKARLENKPIVGKVAKFIQVGKARLALFPSSRSKLLKDLN